MRWLFPGADQVDIRSKQSHSLYGSMDKEAKRNGRFKIGGDTAAPQVQSLLDAIGKGPINRPGRTNELPAGA
jgi:hypothetical protein